MRKNTPVSAPAPVPVDQEKPGIRPDWTRLINSPGIRPVCQNLCGNDVRKLVLMPHAGRGKLPVCMANTGKKKPHEWEYGVLFYPLFSMNTVIFSFFL